MEEQTPRGEKRRKALPLLIHPLGLYDIKNGRRLKNFSLNDLKMIGTALVATKLYSFS